MFKILSKEKYDLLKNYEHRYGRLEEWLKYSDFKEISDYVRDYVLGSLTLPGLNARHSYIITTLKDIRVNSRINELEEHVKSLEVALEKALKEKVELKDEKETLLKVLSMNCRNEYFPWEEDKITEVEYWKKRYLEERTENITRESNYDSARKFLIAEDGKVTLQS